MISLICTAMIAGQLAVTTMSLPHEIVRKVNINGEARTVKFHVGKDLKDETESWVVSENLKGHKFTETLECEMM